MINRLTNYGSYETRETTDMGIFKFADGNRPINKKNAQAIAEAIKISKIIEPILVEETEDPNIFIVWNGQHRVSEFQTVIQDETCKNMKMPYTIIPKEIANGMSKIEKEDAIRILNSNSHNWTSKQIIEHKSKRDQFMSDVTKLARKHNVSPNVIYSIITQSWTEPKVLKVKEDFNFTFDFLDIDKKATKFLKILSEVWATTGSFSKLTQAFITFCFNKDGNFNKLDETYSKKLGEFIKNIKEGNVICNSNGDRLELPSKVEVKGWFNLFKIVCDNTYLNDYTITV